MSPVQFFRETSDKIISGVFKYQNMHIWSQICTLSTQTCTLCSTIASEIFALTFLPHLLKTLVNLIPYKHEHKG